MSIESMLACEVCGADDLGDLWHMSGRARCTRCKNLGEALHQHDARLLQTIRNSKFNANRGAVTYIKQQTKEDQVTTISEPDEHMLEFLYQLDNTPRDQRAKGLCAFVEGCEDAAQDALIKEIEQWAENREKEWMHDTHGQAPAFASGVANAMLWLKLWARNTGCDTTIIPGFDAPTASDEVLEINEVIATSLECVCGEPSNDGMTHRTDGPCHVTPALDDGTAWYATAGQYEYLDNRIESAHERITDIVARCNEIETDTIKEIVLTRDRVLALDQRLEALEASKRTVGSKLIKQTSDIDDLEERHTALVQWVSKALNAVQDRTYALETYVDMPQHATVACFDVGKALQK